MQWKKIKPYRKLIFWSAILIWGGYTLTATPPLRCTMPAQAAILSMGHISEILKTALITVVSFLSTPDCFAPAAVSVAGWPSDAAQALQLHAYNSYVFWIRLFGGIITANAVWILLFEIWANLKGGKNA